MRTKKTLVLRVLNDFEAPGHYTFFIFWSVYKSSVIFGGQFLVLKGWLILGKIR